MDGKIKKIVLLSNGCELKHLKLKRHIVCGEQHIYTNEEKTSFYQVSIFSKSMLQLSNLQQHFDRIVKLYKGLNCKIVSPILACISSFEDSISIVIQVSQFTIGDLVMKRSGLSEFEAVFYLLDLIQIMSYLRSRHCYVEKIQLEDLYLNTNMKIILPFTIFFNVTNQDSLLKYLPFRKQRLNNNFCPQLKPQYQDRCIDQINSWNLGIFIYEILENRVPFTKSPSHIRHQPHQQGLNFRQSCDTAAKQLITKLLKVSPQERIKFQLIYLQPIVKKYSCIPYMLPNTIFLCPPSKSYQSTLKANLYKQNIDQEEIQNLSYLNKQTDIKTTLEFGQSHYQTTYKTLKYVKNTDRSLSEIKVYVQEYVDISHAYGYGYQMNTGTVGFVYNDLTQLYFPNSTSRKVVIYCNQQRDLINYNSDKLPQEQDLKKKLYIMQAYIKSIKKYKPQNQSTNTNQKLVTVKKYAKTKNAAIFQLSNDNIQVLFADKVSFLVTRNGVYFQWKNSDKFDRYEPYHEDNPDYAVRKRYTFEMSKKILNRDLDIFQKKMSLECQNSKSSQLI